MLHLAISNKHFLQTLKSFPLNCEIRQRYLLSPLLINSISEALDRAIRQEKELKL